VRGRFRVSGAQWKVNAPAPLPGVHRLTPAATAGRVEAVSTAVEQRFTPPAVTALRAAIADARGNELFVLGALDEAGSVCSVRVLARGHRHAVPALLQTPRPGEVVIHNHPNGHLTPSDEDLGVAATLGANGIGAYIVNNPVTDVYVVVEPPTTTGPSDIVPTDVAARLQPGSALARLLPEYEHRPQQLAMVGAVVEAFNGDAALTVEAGTGTGKSLAYLLPALHWAVANRERVVVSTHTINLQEQLITKDLPLLIDELGYACTAALVKGRSNYVCRRKVAQVAAQGSLLVEDEQQAELAALLAWAERTADGSLADLAVRPRPEVWEHVVSENDNCLRTRCPHYATCFFYTARRAAAKADVIVVNHHLLMADLALRDELGSYTQNAVLPPARRVIVDEAHHLESVATDYFGERVSYSLFERTLGRLRSPRHEHRGLLPALLMALESVDAPADRTLADGAARWIEQRLLPTAWSLRVDAEQCFVELAHSFQDLLEREVVGGGEEKVRVVPALREQAFWHDLEEWFLRLGGSLDGYVDDLHRIGERVEQMSEDAEKRLLGLLTEVRAVQGRLASYSTALRAFVGDEPGTCRWIELRYRSRGGPGLACASAPTRVGPLLRRVLFEQFPTVVLTSATLTVDRRFDFLHERVGLDELAEADRVRTLRVESPFDFERQAVLAIPRDVPPPTDPGYEPATHEVIAETVRAAGGGTFVLFTAYGALNRAAAALEPGLRALGLTVLRQGDIGRSILLQRFMQDPRAVLFATDSFWEGVDVRGEALRCVIITRLPFRVPTEPIEEARVEAIAARGGNPFAEHTVPQAVIKLKQGFGRLIRSRTDWGAVVLLDSRVVTRPYGRVFLDSLPPAQRLVGDRHTVCAALRDFFAKRW
jgi:ATP-dependent DNA helicase DinG